jgi:chemotaxis protein MotB
MPRYRSQLNADHSHHERWLISYADFITLLFAFFVVLFAASEANSEKARLVSESLTKALGASGKPASGPPPKTVDLTPSLHLLETELAEAVNLGKIQLRLEERGLVISLEEAGFFPAGDDRVEPASYQTFAKVAAALSKLPNPIRVEGHTDSRPIRTPRFHSNWDLSAARAVAVLDLLESSFDFDRARLSAAGYADTAPVEKNDTEAGRSRNRRVDLVVLSHIGMAGQPQSPR